MIYELRIYDAAPGKLAAINRRFNDHTMGLFARHGIEVTGFWEHADGADGQLIYICAFADHAAMDAAWEAFRADPEWIAVKAASEVDGELVAHITSIVMTRTPYAP